MNIFKNHSEIQKCEYLNANIQPAREMLLNCIGNKNSGEDRGCKSNYSKLYDNISINSENISIKRGINAGYGITPNTSKIIPYNIEGNNNLSIEGFTSNMFITDNGPGESNVDKNQCPEGYKWSDESKKCIQVCISCKYNEKMKSQEFNEGDKCFPEGVYDGITNDGVTKCSCGTNNKYCSSEFIDDTMANRNIKNTRVGKYFDFNNL